MSLEAALLGDLGARPARPAGRDLDWGAFGRLSQQLARAQRQEMLLGVALDLLCDPIGAAAAAIWTYRHDDGKLELAAESGLAESDPRPEWTDLFKCPLSNGGRLLGICEAYALEPGGFSEDQIGALQAASALLAGALAALCSPPSTPAAPPTWPETADGLWRLWRATSGAADLLELFELLADSLPSWLEFDAAAYLSLESIPPRGLLQLGRRAALEHVNPLLERLGAALERFGGDPTVIDAEAVELLAEPTVPADGPPLPGELAVPLRRRGELAGVLLLASAEPLALEGAAELLTGFGERVGEALELLAEQRRAEVERLTTIIDSLPQGIVLLDPAGAVLLTNAPGRELLELLGAEEPVVRLGTLHLASELAAAEQSGDELLEREIELRLAERTWNLQLNLVPVREGAELLATVVTLQDVSHRRQTEQRLFSDARLAAVGELAAGLAHELNNPLMIILGLAEMLADAELPPTEQQRALTDIGAAALRAGQIVDQLSQFADAQASEAWDTLDLREISRQAVDLMAAMCERDGVAVTVELPDDLPRVQGNAGRLQQIVLILLRNAYEAVVLAPEHRGASDGRIVVRGRATGSRVLLEVEDTGCGVPEELRERIFDVFFTTKRDWHGKGLGLSIAYRLAKEHGGDLTFEPGERGARFRLSLPAA